MYTAEILEPGKLLQTGLGGFRGHSEAHTVSYWYSLLKRVSLRGWQRRRERFKAAKVLQRMEEKG